MLDSSPRIFSDKECKEILKEGSKRLDSLKFQEKYIELVCLLQHIIKNDKTPPDPELKYNKKTREWDLPEVIDKTSDYIRTSKKWYENNVDIYSDLLKTTIELNNIEIIKWLKNRNIILNDEIIELLIKKQRMEIIDYLYKENFIFPDNFYILATEKKRLDILIWIHNTVSCKSSMKITEKSLVIVAKLDDFDIFSWLANNDYVNVNAFNEIAEMENRFHYLIYLYRKGYNGNKKYTELIEGESNEFITWIIKRSKTINHPTDLYKAFDNRNKITIKKYCIKRCHLAYRLISKLEIELIGDICRNIIITKYLQQQLIENEKLNLLLNKISIPINITIQLS